MVGLPKPSNILNFSQTRSNYVFYRQQEKVEKEAKAERSVLENLRRFQRADQSEPVCR